MKKKILLCFCLLLGVSLFTGCFKRDNLENIQITTTSYPIQYITERLYGEYSTIDSIYPMGVNIQNYELNKKQIKDFSKSSIYIFNGLSKEKDYVIQMFDYNKNIKIIDTSMSMEYSNEVEELWLDPSNFLMLAQNIKNGLQEYIDDPYLKNQIEDKYEELKVDVSNIDASIKLAAESSSNKTIVVSNDLFKFLEKYGYTVISLEENSNLTDKTVADVKQMIENEQISYIFLKENEEANGTIQKIIRQTGVETLTLKTLSNITEEESENHQDYISLMNQNVELLKQELYDE
jgi:zinc transport system substrate-binding protein